MCMQFYSFFPSVVSGVFSLGSLESAHSVLSSVQQ